MNHLCNQENEISFFMTIRTTITICALAALVVSSCGHRRNSKASKTEVSATISFFEDGNAAREPVRLCEAVLTGEKAVLSAFPDDTEDYFKETTPEKDAFYYPAPDIKDEPLVRTVQLRYNYAALFNRVLHSYEWFQRMSTGGDEEDGVATKKDTLEWIRHARPQLPEPVIRAALPDAKASSRAAKLLQAYNRFDGDDSEDSSFSKAVGEYTAALSELQELVSPEETDHFEREFWKWYDKRNAVPEIDTLVRMNMPGYKGEKPTEGLLENMRRAIEAESDIDRRAILALEYVKFDRRRGSVLLGEILESRIYTNYLLEVWLSWRANVQAEHSPSSFSIIANNYYDHLRAVCLDTMVRHCLQTEDKNAECLIENLILCEIVHRMGALTGNSSLNSVMALSYEEFIHPRLLEEGE